MSLPSSCLALPYLDSPHFDAICSHTGAFYWLAFFLIAMTDDGSRVLSRRAFLAGGLASALTPAAIATAPLAAAQVPENAPRVVHVPAGRTLRITLDDGDSLSGLVIDISALEARYFIRSSGSNWEIRNLAIVGRHPRSDATAFAVEVSDPGGIGVIDNVWLGDGSRATVGIFVRPDHAGALLVRRCHVARYTNNGIYASPPGNAPNAEAPGAGGRVRIERSYAYNNAISGFRIGTDGSWVRDSVILQDRRTPASIGGDATRAVWVYYESALIENVDFRMADGTGIVAGSGSGEKSTTEVMLRSVRGVVEDLIDGEEDIRGTVRPNPEIRVPEGCPEIPTDIFASSFEPLRAVGSGRPEIEVPADPAWIRALAGGIGAFTTSIFGPVLGGLIVFLVLLSPGLAILAIVLYGLYRRGRSRGAITCDRIRCAMRKSVSVPFDEPVARVTRSGNGGRCFDGFIPFVGRTPRTMADKPASMYRDISKQPYTRREYITGIPGSKVAQYKMGDVESNPEEYPIQMSLLVEEAVQIRHDSLESARLSANRHLLKTVGMNNYKMILRKFPHHVLRENKQATGAGADRVSDGMRQSFGKVVGTAARVPRGDRVFTIWCSVEDADTAKDALRRAYNKLSPPCRLTVERGEQLLTN